MRKSNHILKAGSILLIVATLVFPVGAITADTNNVQTMPLENNDTVGYDYIDLEIINVQNGFGSISAELENTGTMDLIDVKWTITVTGGILGLIDVVTTDTISTILIGDTVEIQTDKFIFGLGKVDVTIDATYVVNEGTAFVLGPFILNLDTSTVPVVTPWDFGKNFGCTIHMKCNDWAVYISKIEWTKDGTVIATYEFTPAEGAQAAGGDFDLPTMNPPEEPNDFRMYWKAVKGGTVDDATNAPDQEPFYVPPSQFVWRQPYSTNPK